MILLFTKSTALSSFWQKHEIDNAVFAYNQAQFTRLLKQVNISVAAIEIGSVRTDASKFIAEILEDFQNLKLLILSNEPKFNEGKQLLKLGVKGYANSHMQEVHFKDAIKVIQNGDVWLYPEFIQQMIAELASQSSVVAPSKTNLDSLSAREREIARLVYDGLTNKEISDATGIVLRTVKAHTASIYSKLGVKDRMGLVLFMREANE